VDLFGHDSGERFGLVDFLKEIGGFYLVSL
jgi:hypothetical protein